MHDGMRNIKPRRPVDEDRERRYDIELAASIVLLLAFIVSLIVIAIEQWPF